MSEKENQKQPQAINRCLFVKLLAALKHDIFLPIGHVKHRLVLGGITWQHAVCDCASALPVCDGESKNDGNSNDGELQG